jgi:hypothetical protein
MNTSRLIWGIICLALAGLLAVLNFVLPPEKLMFMVGEANAPYLPPIILGIVGIVLLDTATRPRRGEEKPAQAAAVQDPEKADLNKRLETMAWGLFLIMLGGFVFVPRTLVAEGIWSIGVGVIMLGLNVARYFNQIKMSGFTTFLGLIALLGGVLQLFGLRTFEGAVLLIVLGGYLILRPWFDERKLFGKAEEG